MPLYAEQKQKELPVRVFTAATFLSRLAGWLGRNKAEENELLHLVPCRGIHTWGMQFPIDVLFLDAENRITATVSSLRPNKMASPRGKVMSVLEAPAGFCQVHDLQPGDRLLIKSDGRHRVSFNAWRHILHWPMNLFIAILWAQLVVYIFSQGWGHFPWLSLGVLLHNSLLLFLFLLRRPSRDTSRRPLDWAVAFITLGCAMALRPLPQVWETGLVASLVLQATGITGILFSLLSLGRSFGIIPANRSVQIHGAYQVVRHPLYASELVFYAGFLIGHPSLQNLLLAGLILAGQIWRALAEENLLMRDPAYQKYAALVRSRFIPGVF